MIREVLSHSPHGTLAVVGMILFGVVFIGALFWVFRRGAASGYEALAKLPLEEDEDKNVGSK